MEFLGRVFGDARENVGEPRLWVDLVEFAGNDQRVHLGRALAATVGPAEQPCFSPESDAAQRSLGRIVGQADSAVIEEAGERLPAREHVLERLGHGIMARESGPLLAHPALQFGDQRCDQLLAVGQPFVGRTAGEGPFDVEQGVDALYRF